tara:strand:- start:12335 stop:13075 length:741 start_codon:yes stop_codon:yes gene_type:complete
MNIQQQSSTQNKILLVEKDVDQTNTFLQMAKANGWLVANCQGSIEAIRWIKENDAPDLMIIEMDATPLDGMQTHNYIQTELKVNVTVLISSSKDSEIKNYEEQFGFICKPFSTKAVPIIKAKLTKDNVPSKVANKHYSLDYLNNLSSNNEEFILTSLTIFRDSVTVKLKEMNAAIAIHEFKTVRDIAHNIKPTFEMLESTVGSDICNTLVYKATEKEIENLVLQLNKLFETIIFELKIDIPKFTQV